MMTGRCRSRLFHSAHTDRDVITTSFPGGREMKVSELIAHLQTIITDHGDLEIFEPASGYGFEPLSRDLLQKNLRVESWMCIEKAQEKGRRVDTHFRETHVTEFSGLVVGADRRVNPHSGFSRVS